MAISAAMVKALREKTGLPMMEGKQALEESNGDETKAVEILRKKGLGQAGKRTERATSQGRVACYVAADNQNAGLVELQCETAPVANTDDFIKLAAALAQVAGTMDDPTPENVLTQNVPGGSGTIGDMLTDVINKIRENIRVARIANLKDNVGHYAHHNGQVGVLVSMSDDCPAEVKADVCMHIAAMRPLCTRREQVDAKLIAEEREVAAEQAKGKPANIIEKIVDGKMNRWFGEMVLLEQPFVKDDKQSVGAMLASKKPGLTVREFVRYEVGKS